MSHHPANRWCQIVAFTIVVAGCGSDAVPSSKPNGGGARPAQQPPRPGAATQADSARVGAIESAFNDHFSSLSQIDELLIRTIQNPGATLPMTDIDAIGRQAVASRQRLLSLIPKHAPARSHTPTPVEAAVRRNAGQLTQRTQSVVFNLRNSAELYPQHAEPLRALAELLAARPGAPSESVAQSPQPKARPTRLPPKPMPKPAEPTGPFECTAEVLWARLKRVDRSLPRLRNGTPVRVTGVLGSCRYRGRLGAVTLATAEKGAMSLYFGPDVERSHLRPLQRVTVEGELSTVTGLDNLASLLSISSIQVLSEEQVETPPPLFLVYATPGDLVRAALEPGYREANRLIVSMNRPIIVSGQVAEIEQFTNEFRELEKLVKLQSDVGGVVCRFALDEDVEPLRIGQQIRIVGLHDLGFHPGRPKEEIWLGSVFPYPD